MKRIMLLVFISAFIFFSWDAGFAQEKDKDPAVKDRPARAPDKRRIPERIQQQRQRRQRRQRRKLQQMREKGQLDKQKTKTLSGPAVDESGKHQGRLARLKRIRELAVANGDEKIIERVDKLLEKEKQRYRSKMWKIHSQRRKERLKELDKEMLRKRTANPTKKELYRKKVKAAIEQKKQTEKKKTKNDSE